MSSVGRSTPQQMQQAARAEQEAVERVRKAEEQMRRTEQELEDSLENLKDKYEKRSADEAAKREGLMETERDKGYQRLHEMKRKLNQTESELHRQGEKQLRKNQENLADRFEAANKESDEKLGKLRTNLRTQEDYETTTGRLRMENLKDENRAQIESTILMHKNRLNDLQHLTSKEYENMRTNHEQAMKKTEESFTERHKKTVETNDATLNRLNHDTVEKLEDIKDSYSRKITAYGSRARDPFYQPIKIDAEIDEGRDGYVLTARIPPHEQAHTTISISGNKIVLSGRRQTTERIVEGPGRVTESSNFQAYSQTFPIRFPVDDKMLKREFVGDTLIVSVPKKPEWVDDLTKHQKQQPERMRAERPQFPENLPIAKPKDRSSESLT